MTRLKQIKWRRTDTPEYKFLMACLTELAAGEWHNPEQHHNKLLNLLARQLFHCKSSVDYYKPILENFNCNLMHIDDFLKIPILTKKIVREQGPTLIANNFKQADASSKMRRFQTSGSTGTPMQVYRSVSHILFARAVGLHYHLMHQRDFDFSNVNIITATHFILSPKAWVVNVQTGPGYIIPIGVESYIIFEHLLRLQPHYIQTHPSTLKRLIDISLEYGVRIDALKEVRTFGELLENNIKKSCETHWDIALADNYSCEEMGAIGFTCREFGQYHVMTDNVYVEIVDDKGKPCQLGEIGRILITQLKNAAMPLLRYEIGDMGVWGNSCACGRAYPVLMRIEGRRRNLVVLPGGDTFHPVFDEQKILEVANIRRYQVIQKDVNKIMVYILGQALTKEKELALATVFRQSFKHNFSIEFVYQDERGFSERNKFELFKTEVAFPYVEIK